MRRSPQDIIELYLIQSHLSFLSCTTDESTRNKERAREPVWNVFRFVSLPFACVSESSQCVISYTERDIGRPRQDGPWSMCFLDCES